MFPWKRLSAGNPVGLCIGPGNYSSAYDGYPGRHFCRYRHLQVGWQIQIQKISVIEKLYELLGANMLPFYFALIDNEQDCRSFE